MIKINTTERNVILVITIFISIFVLNENKPHVLAGIGYRLKLHETIFGGVLKALPATSLAVVSLCFIGATTKSTAHRVYLLLFATAFVFCGLGDFFLYLEKQRHLF